MANNKLRKRERIQNIVKISAKRTHKGFQKIQPVLNKVKPIVNPRNAIFGFLILSILKPSFALAAPNSVPDIGDLPGWQGNITVAILLAGFIEESTYHTSCMIPGSQWLNSKIEAPIAIVGTYGCAAGTAFFTVLGGILRDSSVSQVVQHAQLMLSQHTVLHLMIQY